VSVGGSSRRPALRFRFALTAQGRCQDRSSRCCVLETGTKILPGDCHEYVLSSPTRPNATKCDTALSDRLSEIQLWLQHAFEVQCFGGPWEGDFPRYAWCKIGNIVYEARLVNRGLGQYKGWQLKLEEWPDEIDNFDWDL
jgi:hypothetical protein